MRYIWQSIIILCRCPLTKLGPVCGRMSWLIPTASTLACLRHPSCFLCFCRGYHNALSNPERTLQISPEGKLRWMRIATWIEDSAFSVFCQHDVCTVGWQEKETNICLGQKWQGSNASSIIRQKLLVESCTQGQDICSVHLINGCTGSCRSKRDDSWNFLYLKTLFLEIFLHDICSKNLMQQAATWGRMTIIFMEYRLLSFVRCIIVSEKSCNSRDVSWLRVNVRERLLPLGGKA